MAFQLTIDESVTDLAVGLVEATGLAIAPPPPDLTQACQTWVAGVSQAGPEGGDLRRQAVRSLLRAGGFKPSGRNKPAQEYLARMAEDPAQWPAILTAVDVLNVISLRSGLPISLLALDRAGVSLRMRYGAPGERFVFNASGQELDVEGLICICQEAGRESVPLGTPVKDSQRAKVQVGDQHILACLFAPRSTVTPDVLARWSHALADELKRWCTPTEVAVQLTPANW